MPENFYSFAPSGPGFDEVRTFAEQIKHVACSNFAFFNEIEHKTPPEHCEKGGHAKAATKSEILEYLRNSFDYGNKVLAAMTDTSAREMVQGQYFGDNTSLTVAVAAVWHMADHYGQLVPYLRMNNIVPPPTEQYPHPLVHNFTRDLRELTTAMMPIWKPIPRLPTINAVGRW
jgi:hypothetical protein